MQFNSAHFLIFLPAVITGCFLLPGRLRKYWLLAASYYFYMSWNAKYALLILASTLITWISGLLLEKTAHKDLPESRKIRLKKSIVAFSFISNLGILACFKYLTFFTELAEQAAALFRVSLQLPRLNLLLPVGISFYTFQALGYTVDVYREKIPAEKDFFLYALFVSFFPQLVAGPIERSGDLLPQLAEPKQFKYDNLREGFLLLLWGFFLKIVLADRIAIFVTTVYSHARNFPGMFLLIAAFLANIQVYCDFSGYSVIAAGSARILGINLTDNFNAPFLSESISEVFRTWHITLCSWFRDYLYIPLGGSRKGKARKYLNLMITGMTSGLWHGADIRYVLWGGLNSLLQILEDISAPARKAAKRVLPRGGDLPVFHLLSKIITFTLFSFTCILFRANSVSHAWAILKSILYVHNPEILFNGEITRAGLNIPNLVLLLVCLLVLLAADIGKRRGIIIRRVIMDMKTTRRWPIMIFGICFLLVFGIWGSNYDPAGFVYFQF